MSSHQLVSRAVTDERWAVRHLTLFYPRSYLMLGYPFGILMTLLLTANPNGC
ncbi:uncharacterized protein FFFS_15999 [Fusarium fujikuroi]|nr:uncharacterized protein FFFS_15999 [Fusarium fujikuroi]